MVLKGVHQSIVGGYSAFLLRSPSFPASLPRMGVDRLPQETELCHSLRSASGVQGPALAHRRASLEASRQGGAVSSHCATREADLQLKFIFSTVADSWSGCGSRKVGELLQSDLGQTPCEQGAASPCQPVVEGQERGTRFLATLVHTRQSAPQPQPFPSLPLDSVSLWVPG